MVDSVILKNGQDLLEVEHKLEACTVALTEAESNLASEKQAAGVMQTDREQEVMSLNKMLDNMKQEAAKEALERAELEDSLSLLRKVLLSCVVCHVLIMFPISHL